MWDDVHFLDIALLWSIHPITRLRMTTVHFYPEEGAARSAHLLELATQQTVVRQHVEEHGAAGVGVVGLAQQLQRLRQALRAIRTTRWTSCLEGGTPT